MEKLKITETDRRLIEVKIRLVMTIQEKWNANWEAYIKKGDLNRLELRAVLEPHP